MGLKAQWRIGAIFLLLLTVALGSLLPMPGPIVMGLLGGPAVGFCWWISTYGDES